MSSKLFTNLLLQKKVNHNLLSSSPAQPLLSHPLHVRSLLQLRQHPHKVGHHIPSTTSRSRPPQPVDQLSPASPDTTTSTTPAGLLLRRSPFFLA
ncbi:hypothetical protein HanLR1_Chr10g0370691 [Helianthus annuus]|nr:hypothetical protein HanHA89_Chr10g0393251 [Helianthus annuus]KAJ0697596.1 hypothetical protein HanLR1_Chr10g0370691 [Helianthus annuus]